MLLVLVYPLARHGCCRRQGMDGIAMASGAVTPRLKGRDRWEDASLLLGTFLYPWVAYRAALEAPSGGREDRVGACA